MMNGAPGIGNFSYVDIRDLAAVITRGLQLEEAGGERFIISGGGYRETDVSVLKDGGQWVERGESLENFDSSKAKRVLGFRPRERKVMMEETARWIEVALAGGKA